PVRARRRPAERLRDAVEEVFGGLETVDTGEARRHWRLRTPTLGEIYITVLARLFTASEGDAPSPEAIAREFKARMANRGQESASGSRA
ncbi:MAG: hypothetical protein OXC31_05970, partial [Spirochaetaceae bacterium]|nr:hypothetical protein [Spirochaetaceae bacterium]